MNYKFWIIGENEIISPSAKNLSTILNALILLRGRLKTSHSLEIKDESWKYPTRSCAVVMLIELPVGKEETFQEMTGFSVFEPQVAHIN